MSTPMLVVLTACGLFFLTALLSGIWKWRSMLSSPEHQAHFYVDTAHRAALLYSFACLVLAKFLELSPYPDSINLFAVCAPLTFFAIAIGTYLRLGFTQATTNQFARPSAVQSGGMWMLIAAEVGGFALLFWGFLSTHLFG